MSVCRAASRCGRRAGTATMPLCRRVTARRVERYGIEFDVSPQVEPLLLQRQWPALMGDVQLVGSLELSIQQCQALRKSNRHFLGSMRQWPIGLHRDHSSKKARGFTVRTRPHPLEAITRLFIGWNFEMHMCRSQHCTNTLEDLEVTVSSFLDSTRMQTTLCQYFVQNLFALLSYVQVAI